MFNRLKYLINYLFEVVGYKIEPLSKITPIDLRLMGNDPRALKYIGGQQPGVIDALMCRGRGLPLFSLEIGKGHPYVYAISQVEVAVNATSLDTIKNVLSDYYSSVRLESALEVLGLGSTEVSGFMGEPSWSALMPWDCETIEQWKKNHQRSVILENKQYIKDLTISDGWAWVGPVSSDKLTVEVTRLNGVYKSIVKNGYKRNNGPDGDVLAVMLVDNAGNWCWQAITGQHRACVMAGLGHEVIPIRVAKVILESDVECWPNVRSGLYSVEAALKVFQMVMNGGVPKMVEPWIASVNTNN